MRSTPVLLLIPLLLAGCAGPPQPPPDGTRVANCGTEQIIERAPQRVVSLNQHATELLLALGLGDRLVGTAYPDDHEPPEQVAEQYRRVPLLAEKYPSFEQVLAADPDLVVGGYASAFDDTRGAGRQALADSGIPTLLLSESCADGPAGMDTLLADIRLFGEVLDLGAEAERLAAQITGRVRAVEQRIAGREPVDVFVYDSGEPAAMTLGRDGVGNDALRRAGGANVFGDVPGGFPDVSWEQVAAREPAAIVLVDYLGAPVGTKRDHLRGHPLVGRTPAARADRFSTIPLVELTEGIRFPDAVERLAADLHGA
ncbi:ABC transporter substrate-binding protein [Saccharopolyspora sp. HNM0983]|uniref:ABC transporter substrate-binding protein n=1 Tax=Saccharopolyspora montiporae TaxID=2781240 RepID=A0A929G0V6_9PSEU|nr:ABC transporter substrate-binding protein [Saccharopolyspora sp. HNM0983]MBE9374018.1 ABC transporter substrate-binding protein [Saccharopolyspora sp. HNM0983]